MSYSSNIFLNSYSAISLSVYYFAKREDDKKNF
jgi:hypothetical protein